jgi:hypothetical protein
MLDGLPERQLTSASFDFKTNTECAKKHKLDQLILAIQKDIPEFASHVSPATSKVYPSRVVANNAAGELIAEAYGVNKLGTTYWTIKYPAL